MTAETSATPPACPSCPLCGLRTRRLAPPLGRWICADCAVSWLVPEEPGCREIPVHVDGRDTLTAPALRSPGAEGLPSGAVPQQVAAGWQGDLVGDRW